jgi:hypothetical protein
MKINENLGLVLRNIYVYDIEACHYNLLVKFGYDVSNLNKDNKIERNTQIGKMMRESSDLSKKLRDTTNLIIDTYINENQIVENDIILRQYDGLILTKPLHTINGALLPLDLRKLFQIFISSINRKMYIAFTNTEKTTVKGVPNRYEKMNQYYTKLCKIALLSSKPGIFKSLQEIKNEILESKDPYLFAIPTEKNNKYVVFLKEYGEVEVSSSTLGIIETDDIDKIRYFQKYILPFTKTLTFEFVR